MIKKCDSLFLLKTHSNNQTSISVSITPMHIDSDRLIKVCYKGFGFVAIRS